MQFKPANTESDAEMKTRAMDYIVREICRKYKENRDSTFTADEIRKLLQGFGPEYINLNIFHLTRGSDLIDFLNERLTLTDKGKKYCKENTW